MEHGGKRFTHNVRGITVIIGFCASHEFSQPPVPEEKFAEGSNVTSTHHRQQLMVAQGCCGSGVTAAWVGQGLG
ncbi:hypothetical protein D9M72_625280 [compost metagenome]